MTHTVIPRVVRSSLSLMTVCAAGLCPVLTAAMPSSAFARLFPRDDGPRCDFDLDQLRRYLTRPDDDPAPTPLGPFLVAESCHPSSRSFIEEATQRFRIDVSDFDGLTPGPHPALAPTESGPPDTPLYLFHWSGPSADPASLAGWRHDGPKRVATAKADADWGALSSKVALRERDHLLDPSCRSTWETDESLRLPVAGALFLFGQLGASRPDAEQRPLKWLGKTGVGVKLKPWLLQEVQLRGGPAVRYDDTYTLSPGQSPERSELFLEAVTRLPLPVVGPLNVEYTSYAVPAATPTDRGQVNQDFKVALPLSSGGQFHVGAKYRWEGATSPTPWVDRMELYMGLQLKR
jgi:hypothetical protein